MATGKSSFVLYCDIIHTVRKLPKEKVADLFLTILAYVNDENPKVDDSMVDIVFEPIKQQLKRDLKKWGKTKKVRSEIGRMGGLSSGKKRSKMKQNEANEAIGSNSKQNEANEAVNVSVNGNVNESVINRDPPVFYSIEHCVVVALNDERWVRSNKATEKELKEFNEVLERRGIYTKNPMDYKEHFGNWKASGKKELPVEKIQQTATLKKL